MAIDLQWNLLTDSSANLGNALTNAAGQIRQHRETANTRNALTNYLANPEDQGAFKGLAARNPEMAFRLEDRHLERARQLRGDQQAQLDYLGQILTDERGQPITAEQYPQALALAQRAGIDVTGHEAYDPQFVGSIVQLHNRLHRVAPVSVAEGARLVNPETGAVVASTPARPRYYPIQPGGRLELDPSYQGPVTDAPPPAAAPRQRRTATNPQTGQQIEVEFNEQTGQWQPVEAPAFRAGPGGAAPGQRNFP